MEKNHAELGKEYFDRGLELANSREYEKSIAEYEKAIAEYKQVEGYETNIELQELVATSYYLMGHTNLVLNHNKEAEVHFTLAINWALFHKISPEHLWCYFWN